MKPIKPNLRTIFSVLLYVAIERLAPSRLSIVVSRTVRVCALWFIAALSSASAVATEVHKQDQEWVLALTWTPGFCAQNPQKKSCSNPGPSRLVLHGLWPQGALECAAQQQARIPQEFEGRLMDLMPGVADDLDDWEWFRHGTCTGWDQDSYWRASFRLLDAVRSGPIPNLLRESGESLAYERLCAAMTDWLGPGADWAISVRTQGSPRTMTELWFYLEADASGALNIAPDNMLAVFKPRCQKSVNLR